MPNNYLSVVYKHIIQVENKNVGLKVCVWGGGVGTNIPFPPKKRKQWGAHAPFRRFKPFESSRQYFICIIRHTHTYTHTHIYIYIYVSVNLYNQVICILPDVFS